MSRAPSPALTFALLAGLAAFTLAAFSPAILNDGDTYWHIRAGEWMLAHGAVLHHDPFSYTHTGAPWHAAEWLAEIAMALAWRGGWAGIHLLFACATAMTAGIVAGALRQRLDLLAALLAAVLGLACITGSLLARPHLLALPLLALWTAGLATARESDRAPSWWLLPLMPLWANLHGSFAFGLALAGALGVEAVVESPGRMQAATGWGLFVIAAVVSSLLTPDGVQGLLFPLRLAGMQGIAHIGEWAPSEFSTLTPFALVLLASLFVLGMGTVKVPKFRLSILLVLVWLALSHARHQMLLGVVAPLLLIPSLATAWPAKQQSGGRFLAAFAASGFAVLIAARLVIPVQRGNDPVTPASVLAHVPRSLREMPVLNDYAFGGYLIWNGVRPFIDSRADLYGDAFLENYAAITAPNKDTFAANLVYYHVRWTIFAADAPVVKLLDAMPDWHRDYSDAFAVVHVKN